MVEYYRSNDKSDTYHDIDFFEFQIHSKEEVIFKQEKIRKFIEEHKGRTANDLLVKYFNDFRSKLKKLNDEKEALEKKQAELIKGLVTNFPENVSNNGMFSQRS